MIISAVGPISEIHGVFCGTNITGTIVFTVTRFYHLMSHPGPALWLPLNHIYCEETVRNRNVSTHSMNSCVPIRRTSGPSFHILQRFAHGGGCSNRHSSSAAGCSGLCSISSQADSTKTIFVGFDISLLQFSSPEIVSPHLKFVVLDITAPFPQEYHEKFDLVDIRLLSYAIKAVDLEKAVRHVLQKLRKLCIVMLAGIRYHNTADYSGSAGLLQWQECDACDS